MGTFRVKDTQELWLTPGFHAPGLEDSALNWHPTQMSPWQRLVCLLVLV